MRNFLLGTALAAASLTIAAAPASAQTLPTSESHPVACGMQTVEATDHTIALENTRRNDPRLFAMMSERASGKATLRLQSSGEIEETFFVLNNATRQYDLVSAVLVYDGILARVWIDVRDTTRVRPGSAQVRTLVRALDTATAAGSHDPSKGILANDIELFGAPPTQLQIEGKTDFLLTDIKEAIQGGFIAGYFSPQDQTQAAGSNMRNILYIDSREGLASTTSLLNTIAHEFQHLIHFARRRTSELFFNEGCSEVASILNGYWNRTNNGYMANTNVDLLTWPSGSTDGSLLLATYERAMTLTHFLHEQYGVRFLYEFVGSSAKGLARIDDGLTKTGLASDVVNAKAALRAFAVANYLQTSSDPAYGYQFKVGSRKPTLGASYVTETLPATGTVQLKRYGTTYMQIAAGAQTVRFSAAGDFRVMAMIYTSGALQIRELAPDESATIGSDGAGDRVVLAIVNLAGAVNDVTWTASPATTSAVDDVTGASTTLRIAAVAPNPVVERATVTFTVADRDPVSLELIDARGQSVRTLLAPTTLDAGTHELVLDASGLPAGYYMAAIRQGERVATHLVVVTR